MLKQKFSSADYPHLNYARSYLRIRLTESCKKIIERIERDGLDDIGFSVGSEVRALTVSANILVEQTILGSLNDMSRKVVVEEMFNQLATKQGAGFTVHKMSQGGNSNAKTMTAKRAPTQH